MSSLNDLNFFSKNNVETVSNNNLNWIDYKIKRTFKERLNESQIILKKYPEKVPVIINECSEDLKDKLKRKMLIQKDMTVAQYMQSLRTKFNINSEESILMFINCSLPTSSTLIGYLYEKNKDNDGFLYISILKENVFG